jgi:hypothetical protein
MLAAARVTLKQHRFEILAAMLAAIAVGMWALFVQSRLDALNVPPSCIDNWLYRVDGPDGAGECAGRMRAWGEILTADGAIFTGEGILHVSVMGMLPFATGLLGGIPIVARELEARTAQTAWSLNGSRLRWLLQQVAPVAILLGLAVIFSAIAASALAADRAAWGEPSFLDIGLHGPLLVVRAFAAFGVGLLVGALLGRTLPAFVLGVALSFAMLIFVGLARDAWLAGLEPIGIGEISPATGELVIAPRTVRTGWGWRTPDGNIISNEEALALVPPETSQQDDPGQQTHSAEWLAERGYTGPVLGVTEEMALGWAPYDGLLFGLVGVVGFAGAIALVNQRRPP